MCRIHIYIHLYIYTLFHGKNTWMIFIHKLLYIKKQTNNKKTNRWVQWTNEFFDVLQPVIKNHSGTFHGMMFFNFIHTMIFSRWTIHFKDWKPFAALNCEALSSVSLIGRTIQFSQSFVQYVWNKYSFIYCSWIKFHNCRDK